MTWVMERSRGLRCLSILHNNKRGSALKTSIDGLLGVAVNELSEFKIKWLLGWKLFSPAILHGATGLLHSDELETKMVNEGGGR